MIRIHRKKHEMRVTQTTVVWLIVASIVTGTFAATVWQERRVKKVNRVKRPNFTQRDWDGIYFENLLEEGLVGNRPEASVPGAAPKSPDVNPAGSANPEMVTGEFAWSKVISRTTIEDEVKRMQQLLAQDITTPVKFKSDYAKVRQSFSVLSLTFAIAREYDQDVRWQKFAADYAQNTFGRAAANARVGTIQAYESCKRRKDELDELVRGGNLVADEPAPDELDWSQVVDRTPLMERLSESRKRLKQLTANQGEFTREMATVLHESEMIAAIALVLTRNNMNDADDEGYVAFAMSMNRAAIQIVAACKTQDYESASIAANRVIQSCDDCHAEWQ